MTSRLSARPMLDNPKRKRRRRKYGYGVGIQSKHLQNLTRRSARQHRSRPFVIEALQVHGKTKFWRTGVRFLYWDGAKLVTSTRRARHYATRAEATRVAREAIKKQPSSIVGMRVIRP